MKAIWDAGFAGTGEVSSKTFKTDAQDIIY